MVTTKSRSILVASRSPVWTAPQAPSRSGNLITLAPALEARSAVASSEQSSTTQIGVGVTPPIVLIRSPIVACSLSAGKIMAPQRDRSRDGLYMPKECSDYFGIVRAVQAGLYVMSNCAGGSMTEP
jgi:hypothetical protein